MSNLSDHEGNIVNITKAAAAEARAMPKAMKIRRLELRALSSSPVRGKARVQREKSPKCRPEASHAHIHSTLPYSAPALAYSTPQYLGWDLTDDFHHHIPRSIGYITAMMATTASHDENDSDYEHWSDGDGSASESSDSDNCPSTFVYHPATPKSAPSEVAKGSDPSAAKPDPKPEIAPAVETVASNVTQPAYMLTYPMMQYTYQTQPQPEAQVQMMPIAYPVAPAYLGYAPSQLVVASAPAPAPDPDPTPTPAAKPKLASNEYIYKPSFDAPKANQWAGRTKSQVQEDNMKIAAREGAYDKRDIEPTGLSNDQMCWVVEVDGSHTLRSFSSIKELKGKWMKDPRFDDAYYFVREKEEKAAKKSKKA